MQKSGRGPGLGLLIIVKRCGYRGEHDCKSVLFTCTGLGCFCTCTFSFSAAQSAKWPYVHLCLNFDLKLVLSCRHPLKTPPAAVRKCSPSVVRFATCRTALRDHSRCKALLKHLRRVYTSFAANHVVRLQLSPDRPTANVEFSAASSCCSKGRGLGVAATMLPLEDDS